MAKKNAFGTEIITLGGSKDDTHQWNTNRIDKYLHNVRYGIKNDGGSPFLERKVGYRKGNITFNYSQEEIQELERCMHDILYFADKYGYAMTDEGVKKISLRDYQKRILKEFQNNRFNIMISSRQSGKCVGFTSLVHILHDDKKEIVPFFKLYYKILKNIKTPTIFDKVKYFLYNLIYILK